MWRTPVGSVVLPRFQISKKIAPVQCLAVAMKKRSEKARPEVEIMDDQSAFYVVRKGDSFGVYKSLRDCQSQVSSSVCDPSVSVFKGYSMQKETEKYLSSKGLKNALFSINVADCREDLFGSLVPCPFQEPESNVFSSKNDPEKPPSPKRLKQVDELGDGRDAQEPESNAFSSKSDPEKFSSPRRLKEVDELGDARLSCILEFDGASRGNPGQAGAGVIVRSEDGIIISKLREGLGVVTNNVAEYKALILGLKYALRKGFQNVVVNGDSKLVCMQVQDLWKIKHHDMVALCNEAKQLKEKFLSFKICHVRREFNSDADAQANFGIALPCGEVYEEYADLN